MILLSDFTDWTSIGVDLFTGAAIAFILATYVPKKLNEDRSLKSFFIDELNFLNKGFNEFIQKVCLDDANSKYIIEELKSYSTRLQDIENAINAYYKLDISLVRYITKVQLFITGTNEMNEQFNSTKIEFTSNSKREIRNRHAIFNRNLISDIAAINAATKKKNKSSSGNFPPKFPLIFCLPLNLLLHLRYNLYIKN